MATTLVLGGTGKTGRRVAARLHQRHVRLSSRHGTPRFDWDDDTTWTPALVLGRRPRDFADYAHDAAATGVWNRTEAIR